MPNLTLIFEKNINISAQVGDIAYYSPTSMVSEFQTADEIIRLGKILEISKITEGDNAGNYKLVCRIPVGEEYPNTTTDFIFFAKDNVVNSGAILGYYSELKFINDSNENFELYSVNFEVVESSK